MASTASSPATSEGGDLRTPETGAAQIHAAELAQLETSLFELNAVKSGFGDELKEAFPDLPSDDSLLARSHHELAALALKQ